MNVWKIRFKSQYDNDYHEINDFWNMNLDGVSVAGIDFFSQEARTASFTCRCDDWMRQYIVDSQYSEAPYIYRGYLRIQVSIYFNNQVRFFGYLKAKDVKKTIIHADKQIWEINYTIVDCLYVIKDFADGMQRSVVAGDRYNIISELLRSLNQVIDDNAAYFNNQSAPAISEQYDSSNWTAPYHYVNLPIFDRASYDWTSLAHETGNIPSLGLHQQNLKFLWKGDELLIIYVDYYRQVALRHRTQYDNYLVHEYLKYAIYKADGISVSRVYPATLDSLSADEAMKPLTVEATSEANFDLNGHLISGNGEDIASALVIHINGQDSGGYTSFALNGTRNISVYDLNIPQLNENDIITDLTDGSGATYYGEYGWFDALSNNDYFLQPGRAYSYYSNNATGFDWVFIAPTNPTTIGMTVPEWIQSLIKLHDRYSADMNSGSQHEIVVGVQTSYFDINAGKVLFTGFDQLDSIQIAYNSDISMLEWIRMLFNLMAAYAQVDNQAVIIRNKLALAYTDYVALPGQVVDKPEFGESDYAESTFDVSLDVINNGNLIAEAINTYWKHIVQTALPRQVSITLYGDYETVNVRYSYHNYILYVISAEYNKQTNTTAIKALAKRV